MVHTIHRAQGVLHDGGDLVLHALRAGAGIDRHHHEVRDIHLRQQIRLHVGDGHKAQHQHHDHRNQNRKGAFDTYFFHVLLPFPVRRSSRSVRSSPDLRSLS